MNYRTRGCDEYGNYIEDRRTRKYQRSINFRYNKSLHSSSVKKNKGDK